MCKTSQALAKFAPTNISLEFMPLNATCKLGGNSQFQTKCTVCNVGHITDQKLVAMNRW